MNAGTAENHYPEILLFFQTQICKYINNIQCLKHEVLR